MKFWICHLVTQNHFQRIQAFQRKADARAVSLILDVNGLESFRGPGYVHPNKLVDIPKGLDSYPCIFTSPDVYIIFLFTGVRAKIDSVRSFFFFLEIHSRDSLLA